MDKNYGLGKHIKAMRKMARMTQAELAKFSGLERTSITNIERGNQQLTSRTLNDIADALGYEVQVKFVRKKAAVVEPDSIVVQWNKCDDTHASSFGCKHSTL
jgi:transcriptional regulator with XRE-family HTH domain